MLEYSEMHKAKGSGLVPWPARLITPPPRLADFDYSTEMFEKDTVISCLNFLSQLWINVFFHSPEWISK